MTQDTIDKIEADARADLKERAKQTPINLRAQTSEEKALHFWLKIVEENKQQYDFYCAGVEWLKNYWDKKYNNL